ncbi:MAG: hypothetical protein JW801_05560 [Bacteroidales bacterium]|nr:hypothetical protein [Bacteroidales bacterium]
MQKSHPYLLFAALSIFVVSAALKCEPDSFFDDFMDTKTVGKEGGTFEFYDILAISFALETFDDDVKVQVTPVNMMEHDRLKQKNDAYSITSSGVQPKKAVNLEMDRSERLGDALTLYKGDPSLGILYFLWSSGVRTLCTNTKEFSYWTFDELAESDRPVRLVNQGSNEAFVYIYNYQLAYPEIDLPIAKAAGITCYTAPSESDGENVGWLEQGSYQFCAEWEDGENGDSELHMRHRYVGGAPPNYTYSLNDNSSTTDPLKVYVDTKYEGSEEGPCPCAIIQWEENSILDSWEGDLEEDWGKTKVTIGFDAWTFKTDLGTYQYEVVDFDYEGDGFVVLKSTSGTEYRKVLWNYIDNDTIYLTILMAFSTREEASNNSMSEFPGAEFKRIAHTLQ